ncbi:ATP-binding protein [Streptomyces solincola]|uniref:ATP-binding protein n=1 Tax=Streptomyces solincola TaxID=2100817 RepID=UPI002159A135|nr:ATP-binding protein [Streptomyces solincola]
MVAVVFEWAQRFSSTRRGARLARRLAVLVLDEWGVPHDHDVSERVALIVAELAANAVTHGRVAGRDFELRVTAPEGVVRVAVSDAREDRLPVLRSDHGEDGGYGLHLIEALSDRWGTEPRSVGKTVWAEVARKEEGQRV